MRCSKWSKDYIAFNTKTNIKNESIHVYFYDKLGSEKLKLAEKFAGLKNCMPDSEGKESEERDFENC